jgi:type IV pilus assembly protein PilM
LALTLEGTDVRLVSYHNNAIESWKSVSFDARLLKMGQVADPEGLGEVIKNAITDIETNRCYVICALPGLRSVSRIITIPNVGKKELDSVVSREVRRTMTVSEEDNYFHWQILPSETETAQIRVFLLAVPKEPMSLLLRAFSHAGLNPSIIDLKPLALMRAVNQKDAIIANCEGNSMELVIVSDDVPVLIRSVFLGEGVANQDYAIGRISDELGRTIVTYNEINKEHPLNPDVPVYLTGATAAGVPFALNVAALTGRTVQPLESPIPLPADLPIAQYMVNIGLILKVV